MFYGDNDANARVGSAPGKDIRRGQKVGDDPNASSEEGGSEASDEAGEEYYDVENHVRGIDGVSFFEILSYRILREKSCLRKLAKSL